MAWLLGLMGGFRESLSLRHYMEKALYLKSYGAFSFLKLFQLSIAAGI